MSLPPKKSKCMSKVNMLVWYINLSQAGAESASPRPLTLPIPISDPRREGSFPPILVPHLPASPHEDPHFRFWSFQTKSCTAATKTKKDEQRLRYCLMVAWCSDAKLRWWYDAIPGGGATRSTVEVVRWECDLLWWWCDEIFCGGSAMRSVTVMVRRECNMLSGDGVTRSVTVVVWREQIWCGGGRWRLGWGRIEEEREQRNSLNLSPKS